MISQGEANKGIADCMNRQESTIKNSVSRILKKLNLSNRAAISTWYVGRCSEQRQQTPNLEGFWLSRYTFRKSKNNALNYQFGIEQLVRLKNGDGYRGENIITTSSTSLDHHHKITIDRIRNNYLLGEWENTNTSHFGMFMFVLHSNVHILSGTYLGNSSRSIVTSNEWEWLKIANVLTIEDLPQDYMILDFNYLNKIFGYWIETEHQIDITDVFNL